jgi:hypothetical protein
MDYELADFYKVKLRQIAHPEVGLNTAQALAVIGKTRLEELAKFSATITNDMQLGRKKPRSMIPPSKRFVKEGFVMVNRMGFLKAISDAEDELFNPRTVGPIGSPQRAQPEQQSDIRPPTNTN